MKSIPNRNIELSTTQRTKLLTLLKERFERNIHRHKDIQWAMVVAQLEQNPDKLWSLHEMEKTGGEPDVVESINNPNEYIFYDCSAESPSGRRSLCYDKAALDSRKEFKPKTSAVDMAEKMGIEMLTEEQYRLLQEHGIFDTKTSSWLKTPSGVRALGGAIFADRRYDRVFVFHNGAESYYASRGFRGLVHL